MANTYLVRWEIELDGDTPLQAALEAREIQLDVSSLATVFTVVRDDTLEASTVDLAKP